MYSAEYFDNYYGGNYEKTYLTAFPLERVLKKEWKSRYKELPDSFADIGCGCGQTLLAARKLIPAASLIYGVESQDIPKERVVSKDVIFGDFMEIYRQLPIVDLLYVSCSMYIPWGKQTEFLTACALLARKAVVFANLYVEDGDSIPYDILRTSIYKSRAGFQAVMDELGFKSTSKGIEFFIPKIN